MIERRAFLRNGLLAAGTLLVPKYSSFASSGSPARNSRVEVLLDEPLGTISPNIYGHFTENLGAVIYDGIWVGENSSIPNVNGIRSAGLKSCWTNLWERSPRTSMGTLPRIWELSFMTASGWARTPAFPT